MFCCRDHSECEGPFWVGFPDRVDGKVFSFLFFFFLSVPFRQSLGVKFRYVKLKKSGLKIQPLNGVNLRSIRLLCEYMQIRPKEKKTRMQMISSGLMKFWILSRILNLKQLVVGAEQHFCCKFDFFFFFQKD